MYQTVYLILVLCILNGNNDELMVCNELLHWSSFRSNLYEFIYNIWSATDYNGKFACSYVMLYCNDIFLFYYNRNKEYSDRYLFISVAYLLECYW